MSNLNEFIASVKSGVAKTSHFTVQLTLPQALTNIEPIKSNIRTIILFCDQTQLPGTSFNTTQVRAYGEFKEVPYEKLYETVTMSFYVDVNMNVRLLFDKWQELIQDPTTRNFNFASLYTTDSIKILVHDSAENTRYICDLKKAYPKAISATQLDYAGKDVMKLQVTFAYQWAEYTQVASPAGSQLASNDFIAPQVIGAYNYGYEVQPFAEIPNDYYNNFAGFQDQYKNQDISIGGVKTSLSLEDVGVRTGFGGIFI